MNLFYKEASVGQFSQPLHAMRGLAAIVVFMTHFQKIITEHTLHHSVSGPFNGTGAVTLFFVLSGLVVGASLARKPVTVQNTFEYGIRRFFRIMPLMFVTVTLGGIYLVAIDPYMPQKFLPESFGELTLVKFLSAYVGYSLKPNPPIWSIFVELIASALLPLMVLSGQKIRYAVATFLILLAVSSFDAGWQNHWNIFMIDFYAGLSILWWGRGLADKVAVLSLPKFWMLIGVLFLTYYVPRLVFHTGEQFVLFNLVELVPVTLLTAIVFYCPKKFVFLAKKPFQMLGDISFSLYLTHSLVQILVLNLLAIVFPGLMANPLFLILPMAILAMPIALGVAMLSYRFIELPFIKQGQNMIRFYRNRQAPA